MSEERTKPSVDAEIKAEHLGEDDPSNDVDLLCINDLLNPAEVSAHDWAQSGDTCINGSWLRSSPGSASLNLLRCDTLESNPIMVDPNEVSSRTVDSSYQNEGVTLMYSLVLPDQVEPEPSETPSPTCMNPATHNWPGVHNFSVTFQRLQQHVRNKSWEFSPSLNKLFIDFNKNVLCCFSTGASPPNGLFVRALPVYAEEGFYQEPVKRCPTHAETIHSSNVGFAEEHRWHLIRAVHRMASYQEDPSSHRLSVVVPLERPQGGTESISFPIKFMCLGSDAGGINRKPVKVTFTLEHGPGHVVGRYCVDVRICSCPRRDRQQEESRLKDKADTLSIMADRLAKSYSIKSAVCNASKKRKVDMSGIEDMVMLPVARADYEKLNELAEAAMIVRNLPAAQHIRETRKRLFEKHNAAPVSSGSFKG